MRLFSERTGIVRPFEIIIKKRMTPEIQNAIANCYARLDSYMCSNLENGELEYKFLERYLWTNFFNRLSDQFKLYYGYFKVSEKYVCDSTAPWYRKLDMIEVSIQYLKQHFPKRPELANLFKQELNMEFERLYFGYRIVDDIVVELTSDEEIQSIQRALDTSSVNIQGHLQKAMQLYAQRPEGDYRNSIKESISAVEAYCRDKTGESTLGKALGAFKKKGAPLQKFFEAGLQDLYNYTNQPDTGIRHSLMDTSDEYVPTQAEALFMLVTCSAFINYFNNKLA